MGYRSDEIDRIDPVDERIRDGDNFGLDSAVDSTVAPDITWGTAGTDADAEFGTSGTVDYASTGDGDEVEATRAQIEQTRAEMSETIDAIQSKLSPQNLKEEATSAIRDATVGKAEDMVSSAGQAVSDAVSSVGDAVTGAVSSTGGSARGMGGTVIDIIRQNPVPAALVGLGLGWLFVKGRQSSQTASSPGSYRYQPGYDYDREYTGYGSQRPPTGEGKHYYYQGSSTYQTGGQGGGTGQNIAGQAQSAVSGAVDQAGSVASNVVGSAQDAAGQVTSTAQDVAGQVTDTAQQVGYQAQVQAQRAAGSFQSLLQERPLAAAAGAVALGVAVGLAIPETPQEDRLMGEARQNLVHQAQHTVQETAQKAQAVAEQAVGAAKSEAQNQNLV